MQLKHRKSHERGYILLGALALAVIIAVAVSMALLSAQQKMDETRGKEANIEARLAMDSIASRIITKLDLSLENQGSVFSDSITSVAFNGIGSGVYSIQSVVPATGIGLDPFSLYQNPLLIHPYDPLLPDVRMNVTNVAVSITTATTSPGYSNYISTYTFQVRAIPVSDFAVFNPGMQSEIIQLGIGGESDAKVTDGSSSQTNIPVYVGGFSPGTNGGSFFSGYPTHILNAQAAPLASRFFRTVANTNLGTDAVQGSPKWDNAASIAFGSMVGEFENYLDYNSYPNTASELTTFGSLHSTDASSLGQQIDPNAYYTNLTSSFQTAPYSAYSYMQVTNGNPLFLSENLGFVAILDLNQALTAVGNPSQGPKEKTLILGVPSVGGNAINTIVVTNSATLPGNFNVTFPPSTLVLLADHVNLNAQRLRMEGNIGFLPQAVDMLGITNSTINQRSYPGVYSYAEAQPDLLFDGSYPFNPMINATNIPVVMLTGTNVNSTYDDTAGARALYTQLQAWAYRQQDILLSAQNVSALPGFISGVSTGPNPYYNPSAAAFNLTYNLAIFPLVSDAISDFHGSHLIPSGNPITTVYTGTITNMHQVVLTNNLYQYSFAGFTTGQNPCSPGSGSYYYLNTSSNMVDTYMPSNATAISPQVSILTDSEKLYATNLITQSFLSLPAPGGTLLYNLDSTANYPHTSDYIETASIGVWQPYNLSASQLLSSINDTNDISLSFTFAIAWIEVVTNTFDSTAQGYYYETFDEHDAIVQPVISPSGNSPGFTPVQTNAPTYSDFSTNAIEDTATATTWYDYLQAQWQAGTTGAIVPPNPTFRFANNAYNTASGNQGAWRRTDSTVQMQNYNTSETNYTVASIGTNYTADFNQRQIIFHYQTIGWALTNSAVTLGLSPTFNGRLVVSDGIKEILGYIPTNVVINGQVTYTHRLHSAVYDNSTLVPNYTVNHDQHTYPLDCAERLYDIRIYNTDTRRH
jgi:hypothetical protein